MKNQVGGGPKKVLYTLQTVKRIGLKNSAKALRANNACKACGLGMGGQKGGMVNEAGEFPSVCNKSVQAQSTDIQQPIPREVFLHNLQELREVSARELEHMGRLANPIYKAKDSDRFCEVSWEWALEYAARKFKDSAAQRSFFYSSGRSSNEAGFVMQLFARLYGTNNISNCSFYCHQATGVGLGTTLGTATSTVELEDLSKADFVMLLGANPASNHPRFIYQLKDCRERGGSVVVANPAREPGLVKFAAPKSMKSLISGGSPIATHYLQPCIGGDIALIKGLCKAILEMDAQDQSFIDNYCHGFDEFRTDIEQTTWVDIETACGIRKPLLAEIAEVYSRAKNAVFAWGMGITHHRFGCENVEYIANLALLRGMAGKRYAGLLPLRGHSNVQGIGTIGVKPVLAQTIFDAIEKNFAVTLPVQPGFDTHGAMRAAEAGEMDAALIMGGNLYSATPDTAWAERALDNIGFKLYLTTTLNQGHINGCDNSESLILPVAARDEETQSTTQESMFSYVRLSDGGISRLDNVRSEVAILADLARRVVDADCFDFGVFKSHQTIREAIASVVPGMAELADIGISKKEFHIGGRLIHRPEFRTLDKKARFVTHPIPNANFNSKEYPYLLATIRSEGQFNSIIYEETDSYRREAPRDALLMSQEDMDKLGIGAGERVNLVSSMGRLEKLTATAFDVVAGSVLAYYPEANVLTGQSLDPRSHTPNFKSVPVRIEPVLKS